MPRRALTTASVERLKAPANGQVDHFDKGYPGLALRLSYGGGKSWVFFYRFGGRLRRMTFGTYPAMGLAEAREAWRVARARVAKGMDPARGRREGDDFETVVTEWFRRDQAENKSYGKIKRRIEKDVLPEWRGRHVNEITRRDVRDLVDGIADRGAVVMARRVHSHLHRFFAWCIGRDILEVNPVAGLAKPGSETPRDRVLSDEELVKVWRAAEEIGWPIGVAVQLLILTGARREEIWQLRWSEIDAGWIKLVGERTKNGEPHLIPLSATAKALLDGVPRLAGSGFVFATRGEGKGPSAIWSRAKAAVDAKAKIEPWTIHDLRRTTATGLQKLGVALPVTEAVLGHTSGSRGGIVGVYQRHDYAGEKRAALETWGRFVMSLVDKPANNIVELRA